jgi:eukaryotic-like serine/threonine-protein kinase
VAVPPDNHPGNAPPTPRCFGPAQVGYFSTAPLVRFSTALDTTIIRVIVSQPEQLGRYRLESFLGEGGMGRVYRAFDPSLGRPVAIKILPAALLHDRDRLDRFVREARTASALNHPNVVTIYEIGSSDGTQFIAMELLDGETLRERGKLELRRAIEIIAQVADGVAAAHSAGVIHRDLKPENIIITKSGFAKILDFGLAKLREPSPPGNDGATARKTDPGTILGSAGYMSPEQAAGRNADHRTDIFSLGCILYEALSGRRAFAGESSIDTLHKIIHDDPRPLRELSPDVPSELQRIVRKCLAKDPDERYQSAKDLAIDLRGLRREMDSQPGVAPALAGRKSRTRTIWIVPAIIALAIIATIPFLRRSPRKPAVPMTVTRITASGNVIGAAISANGEYAAYAYSEAGKQSLLVRQLTSGSTLELVPPSPIGMWGLTFSPDSRSVYYVIKSGSDPGSGLYEIPILGGTPRRLLQRIDSSVTFSPDRKQIAFVRLNEPKPGHSAIVIANADGSGEKVLTSKSPPDFYGPIFWGAPSWSPDGKLIATPLHTGRESKLVLIDRSSGREQSLTKESWSFVGHVCWLHDASGIVLVGSPLGRSERQLWLVSFPDGQRKQITNDLFDYRIVSLTDDDQSLLTVASDQTAAVWLAPLAGGGPAKKLTSGKYDGTEGVAAASNAVVFTSLDSGKWDLWSVDPQGNGRRQVTASAWQSFSPALSPDGRFIVFATPQENDWQLARINRDGGNLKMLCRVAPVGPVVGSPDITPDGKWVIFQSAPDGVSRLWKVSIDGGTPVLLLGADSWRPSVSPDGKSVAFVALSAGSLHVAPLSSAGPTKTFEKVSVTNYCMVRWTPDGKALLNNCGLNDRKNMWLQPIDGSPPHQITHFDDQLILGFNVMPGGKELAVVRGVLSRDAVLIKNFR